MAPSEIDVPLLVDSFVFAYLFVNSEFQEQEEAMR